MLYYGYRIRHHQSVWLVYELPSTEFSRILRPRVFPDEIFSDILRLALKYLQALPYGLVRKNAIFSYRLNLSRLE